MLKSTSISTKEKNNFSVRIKNLEAGGPMATGFPKAGGPTENPMAKIVFHKS